ncbi:hypothetical protein WCLP8_3940005 [uncultured Gammaproteobacteria bacterium]
MDRLEFSMSVGVSQSEPIDPRTLWGMDLSEVEGSFLRGKAITDLPTFLDSRVPAQGSVLLDRIVNIDDIVPAVSWWNRLVWKISRTCARHRSGCCDRG